MFDVRLEQAWKLRQSLNQWCPGGALRIFYGPGEGRGVWSRIAIDRFDDGAWVTSWGTKWQAVSKELEVFLREIGVKFAVGVQRKNQEPTVNAEWLFGFSSGNARRVVKERLGGHSNDQDARYQIRFLDVKHPGLFLDHLPLREWLVQSTRGCRVLNLFAYTGSLSVAAAIGGASELVTVDLSRPTLQWAEENFGLNRSAMSSDVRASFVTMDVFDWLKRAEKREEIFDVVISDPPSFSRGKSGVFSTQKDLLPLHRSLMRLVKPGGFLVTSINSENVSWEQFEREVKKASQELDQEVQVIRKVDLPESFPTRLGFPGERYLKGWILRRVE